MDIAFNLILFLHVASFVLALGAGMALMRIAPLNAKANDDQKSVLHAALKVLGSHINIGIGLLWLTGILMLWLKYNWGAGISHWFWMKMVFVVILSAAAGIGSKARRLLMAGDAAQAPKARMMGQVAVASGLLAILCAILTFN